MATPMFKIQVLLDGGYADAEVKQFRKEILEFGVGRIGDRAVHEDECKKALAEQFCAGGPELVESKAARDNVSCEGVRNVWQ